MGNHTAGMADLGLHKIVEQEQIVLQQEQSNYCFLQMGIRTDWRERMERHIGSWESHIDWMGVAPHSLTEELEVVPHNRTEELEVVHHNRTEELEVAHHNQTEELEGVDHNRTEELEVVHHNQTEELEVVRHSLIEGQVVHHSC